MGFDANFDLQFTATTVEGLGEEVTVIVQPERVNITSPFNTGLYVYAVGGDPFFLSQEQAEKLRDTLIHRYGGAKVPTGPLESFSIACDVEPEDFLSVSAAEGDVYIAVWQDLGEDFQPGFGDVQLTTDSAQALIDSLQELVDNLDSGDVWDAEGTDEIARARAAFERAQSKLALCRTMAQGGVGDEHAYASAYQRLVTLGVEPQIKRRRYR